MHIYGCMAWPTQRSRGHSVTVLAVHWQRFCLRNAVVESKTTRSLRRVGKRKIGANMSVYDKACAWCAKPFTTNTRDQRFCGRSCSAKWRMRQPEIIAKVHAPEVAAKRGERASSTSPGRHTSTIMAGVRLNALECSIRLQVQKCARRFLAR